MPIAMPTYDYRRLDDGRVYEVKHPMAARALKNPSAPPCAAANACRGGGACGFN
jgi:hypothetical protein